MQKGKPLLPIMRARENRIAKRLRYYGIKLPNALPDHLFLLNTHQWMVLMEQIKSPDLMEVFLSDWMIWAREDQLPPMDCTWKTWLLLGGRGAGKTRAGAEWVRGLVEGNKVQHIALIGETFGDVREVMIEGPSGLRSIGTKDMRPHFEAGRHRLVWPNGATAHIFSAEAPEGLRGYQFEAAWADEICKWRYVESCWSNLQLALRLGENPRQVVTTTPKPSAFLKRLMAQKTTHLARSRTKDNAHNLAHGFFDNVAALYQGTRLGRQELDGEAQAKAHQFFHEIRARATTISFSLPPERLDLEPGDLITIEGFPVPTIFCISEISVDDVLTLRAQKRAQLSDLPSPISTRSLPPPPPVWPQPVFGIIDAPILDLSGLAMTPSLLAYAYSAPWPGSLFVYDQGTNGGWRGEIGRPSLIGRLSADLPPGVTARWQYGQTILCQLQGGALASMDALSVLDGGHLVFIDHGEGQWELVQFQQAIEGVDGTWSLSNLLRGQGGTETLAAQTIAAGARLVFYNKNLLPLALETFQFGADYRYGAGPANLSPNDPTFQTVDFSANKIGLRPLAPVHLRIASAAAGLNLSWIRRSRIGGDEWGVAEIPLVEEEERYHLRFSVNGATVFEVESSMMAYLWSQQDQQSALAGQTSGLPVHLSIAQFSQSFGYGEALEAIISFVP